MDASNLISICYHFPSLDTTFALVYLKYHYNQFPQFTFNFYQTNHRTHQEALNLQVSHTIYFIGFLPTAEALVQCAELAGKVIVLSNKSEDAHKLQAKFRGKRRSLDKVKFTYPQVGSPERSISAMCREFFAADTLPVPQNIDLLANYAEDTEQFKYLLPRSREVASGLYMLCVSSSVKILNPSSANFLEDVSELTLDTLIEMGHEQYVSYTAQLEDALSRDLQVVWIEAKPDQQCLCLETENKRIKSEVRTSQLGHRLATMSKERGFLPVGIVAHPVRGNFMNLIALSFRGIDDFDVSEICRRNGGGGFKQAAQCRINRVTFNDHWVQQDFT